MHCVSCRLLERICWSDRVFNLSGVPSRNNQQQPRMHVQGLLQTMQCWFLRLQSQQVRAMPAWKVQQREWRYSMRALPCRYIQNISWCFIA